MIRILPGAALFLGGFAFYCQASGAPLAMFINFHGLLLSVCFVAAGLSLAGWRPADLVAALRGGGGGGEEIRQDARSLRLLESFERAAAGSALLSALVGAVLLFASLGAPARFGPALAVALLAPLYCLAARLFATALKSGIRRAALERRFASTS